MHYNTRLKSYPISNKKKKSYPIYIVLFFIGVSNE